MMGSLPKPIVTSCEDTRDRSGDCNEGVGGLRESPASRFLQGNKSEWK